MEFVNDRLYAKTVAEYEVAETVKDLSNTNDIAESIYSRHQRLVEIFVRELAFDYGVEESEIMDAIRSDAFNF